MRRRSSSAWFLISSFLEHIQDTRGKPNWSKNFDIFTSVRKRRFFILKCCLPLYLDFLMHNKNSAITWKKRWNPVNSNKSLLLLPWHLEPNFNQVFSTQGFGFFDMSRRLKDNACHSKRALWMWKLIDFKKEFNSHLICYLLLTLSANFCVFTTAFIWSVLYGFFSLSLLSCATLAQTTTAKKQGLLPMKSSPS